VVRRICDEFSLHQKGKRSMPPKEITTAKAYPIERSIGCCHPMLLTCALRHFELYDYCRAVVPVVQLASAPV